MFDCNLFSSNTSYITIGMEQWIYEKYHHNIKYGELNFDIRLLPRYNRNLYSQCSCQKLAWMNKEIISYLKKRSKLTTKCYNNPKDKDLLVNSATECSILIIASKEKTILDLKLNFKILTYHQKRMDYFRSNLK